MTPDVEALIQVLAEARTLLAEHGYTSVVARLHDLEARLARGDTEAVVSAVSEATGSAGSLRDVYLYGEGGADLPAANARLDTLVREVERTAREAAGSLGLRLVR